MQWYVQYSIPIRGNGAVQACSFVFRVHLIQAISLSSRMPYHLARLMAWFALDKLLSFFSSFIESP